MYIDNKSNGLNVNPDFFSPNCPASAFKNSPDLYLYTHVTYKSSKEDNGFIHTDLKQVIETTILLMKKVKLSNK